MSVNVNNIKCLKLGMNLLPFHWSTIALIAMTMSSSVCLADSRLVGQWANDMSSSLEVCGMVRYLCGEIPTTFSNVLQSTPVTELQPVRDALCCGTIVFLHGTRTRFQRQNKSFHEKIVDERWFSGPIE